MEVSYELWRASFRDDQQAARAAFDLAKSRWKTQQIWRRDLDCITALYEADIDNLLKTMRVERESFAVITDEMIDAACEAVPDMYRVDAARAIEAALAVMLDGD